MMFFGYVYRTTNLINGKLYIGIRKGKWKSSYYGSGVLLKKALSKYGINNFKVELIEFCIDRDALSEREVYWINYYNSRVTGYNIDGGGKSRDVSDNTKEKLSKAHKGKILTEKHKENIIKANKLKRHTQEAKIKMSETRLGRTHTDYTKKLIGSKSVNRNWKKGHKLSDETKRLIGESSKGRWVGRVHSSDTKLKMSIKRKEFWKNKNSEI